MAVGEANIRNDLSTKIGQAHILIVGAGGIGCELLKNVVLSGFKDIHIIDLDIIDVSNLNRQFLFQREHVGKPKAKIATESVQSFGADCNVVSYHDSIMNPEYNVEFFRQFTMVLNALDNRAARNHVNRMCLAADVPLVESGTAGYLGQVTVIKKGITECYECQPKPTQKAYPGCTIRNTPSEPIHCIVWAKHLFNQLFGEADGDEEVSPDTDDPELAGEAGKKALDRASEGKLESERVSTRCWAKDVGYDGEKLFNKFFYNDIKYLLSMDKLWKTREAPVPLTWDFCVTLEESEQELNSHNSVSLKDKQQWTVKKCALVFRDTVTRLYQELEKSDKSLVWDKDDDLAMDFVTASSNLRSYLFHIGMKTRFDVKSMAGNIIPAIATTNAIIAGLLVLEGLKVLSGNVETCRTVYLNRIPNYRKKVLVPCKLERPNPHCYVCALKPEVTVHLNVNVTTVKIFEEKLLKERLGMVAPDVEIEDGKGTILISSEEGETEENACKALADFKIGNGSRLKGDDFLQNYQLIINIKHDPELTVDSDFRIEVQVARENVYVPMTQTAVSSALNNDEDSEGKARKRKLSDLEEKNPKKTKFGTTSAEIVSL